MTKKEERELEKLAKRINKNFEKLLKAKMILDTIAYVETMERIFKANEL